MQSFASKASHQFLLACLLFLLQITAKAQDSILVYCPSTTNNYTSGSQYETNLNRLLPSLVTNGPLNYTSFYNTTSGEDPNRIYGFSQCMSKASKEDCQNCLKNSTVEIVRRCPNKRSADIRYYNCILRYADGPFLSGVSMGILVTIHNSQNATDSVMFNNALGGLMNNLTSEAASEPSKYADGLTNLGDFQHLYGLVQCTRDLSADDCTVCLQTMIGYIPDCCERKTAGNVYAVSCNIRYDPYLFFSISSPPPPLLPPTKVVAPPPRDSDENSEGKEFILEMEIH